MILKHSNFLNQNENDTLNIQFSSFLEQQISK